MKLCFWNKDNELKDTINKLQQDITKLQDTINKLQQDITIIRETTATTNQKISEKEEDIKLCIKTFMLDNFNIEALDDKIEGDVYDFITNTITNILKTVF